jgi:hypothetical protein
MALLIWRKSETAAWNNFPDRLIPTSMAEGATTKDENPVRNVRAWLFFIIGLKDKLMKE